MSIIPTQPTWHDPGVAQRTEHSALRYRMLTGDWYKDLVDELNRQISETRQDAWGELDMSSNIFKESSAALTALYQRPPTVSNPDALEGSTEGFLGSQGLLTKTGLWARQKRVQFLTIGMRECFIRVDCDGEKISYRIVPVHCVNAEADPNDPERPVIIKEMRLRENPEMGKPEWTIDYLDISDPENPRYEVWAVRHNTKKENLTNKTLFYLGSDQSGENYPYVGVDGKPYLPYSLYHAELTGELFDTYYNIELVKGSLTAAVDYCYYQHLLLDCSYPQRYMMGVTVAGLTTQDTGTGKTAVIETDPASILNLTPDLPDENGNIQPQIGQFNPGGDPQKQLEANTNYERRLATLAGIKGSDIQRMSGDPKSGYAISISRSALREAQAQYTPSFRKADLETIEITAKMSNSFLGTAYPESGYQILYYELPKSSEELKAEREERNDLLDRELISKIQAVMSMYPDYDRDDAIRYLQEVKRDNLLIM